MCLISCSSATCSSLLLQGPSLESCLERFPGSPYDAAGPRVIHMRDVALENIVLGYYSLVATASRLHAPWPNRHRSRPAALLLFEAPTPLLPTMTQSSIRASTSELTPRLVRALNIDYGTVSAE